MWAAGVCHKQQNLLCGFFLILSKGIPRYFFPQLSFRLKRVPAAVLFPATPGFLAFATAYWSERWAIGICWLNENFWHQWPFAAWQVGKNWGKHSHPILLVTEFRWLQNGKVLGNIKVPLRGYCWEDQPWGIFEVCERPSLPHSISYCQSWILWKFILCLCDAEIFSLCLDIARHSRTELEIHR